MLESIQERISDESFVHLVPTNGSESGRREESEERDELLRLHSFVSGIKATRLFCLESGLESVWCCFK